MIAQPEGEGKNDEAFSNAAYLLLNPGKILNPSALNHLKCFRNHGNKPGAEKGWQLLQECKLGKLIEDKAQRGTEYVSLVLMLHKTY